MKALCMVLVLLASAFSSLAGENPRLNIGFSADFFMGINEDDAVAAMKVWSEGLARKRGITINAKATVYADQAKLAEALSRSEADLVIVLSPEMLAMRAQGLLEPQFVSLRNGRPLEEYLVLVREDSGIQNLTDLKQKSMVIQSNARASLAAPWLEGTLREYGMDLRTDFSSVSRVAKVSKVVLPVFFKKNDACLVTRSGYRTLCEFNPQLAKQLVVLAESPGFVPTAICFRKGFEDDIREDLYVGLTELHEEPRGQQLLLLFKVDALDPYHPELMKSAEFVLGMESPVAAAVGHAQNNQNEL